MKSWTGIWRSLIVIMIAYAYWSLGSRLRVVECVFNGGHWASLRA
jgi:hypothetical protein